MAKSSLTSGVASRYAQSLFDIALDSGSLGKVEEQLGALESLFAESEDLRRLIGSPVFSTGEQLRAITAIADKAGLDGVFGNFLKVVASNRRLFALPGMIKAFRAIVDDHKGIVTAQVTSAFKLTAAQEKDLKATLKDVAGKDVEIDLTVDPSLLGGLIVKIGSRQIDTSLRTKLSSMKLALKEVG
ncbi:F0F1 ATP synthase subunit delta [Oricola indica]|uniref:F0F1 ATP synthase subunit delta n=1 Tax=Oricola indica TaxID=2872591 RepID=UPI001CC17D5F